MITRQSTLGMSREAWLSARQGSIGGSDAAAILGLSKYNSAYSLWAEKTGKLVPEDISDKECVRLGNDLEQYVAERFCEATGKRVRRDNSIIRNDAYPFAHANVDRMVVGEDAGLECKTTSSYEIAKQLKDGKIPDMWYCQMVHYMMVTGAKHWYLGALVFGVGFFWYTIERNEAEIAALCEAELEFWGCVTTGTPPAIDGTQATTDAVKVILKDSMPGSTVDLTAVGNHIDCYTSLKRQIAELEEQLAYHENSIKDFMGAAEKGIYGSAAVSWKSSTRKTLDKSAYEQAHGKIDERYYKVSECRTFRVTTGG